MLDITNDILCSKCGLIRYEKESYQCRNGHLICHQCQPITVVCLYCQVLVDVETPIKCHLAVDILMDKVRVPCFFKPRGCGEEKRERADMRKHMAECPFSLSPKNNGTGETTSQGQKSAVQSGNKNHVSSYDTSDNERASTEASTVPTGISEREENEGKIHPSGVPYVKKELPGYFERRYGLRQRRMPNWYNTKPVTPTAKRANLERTGPPPTSSCTVPLLNGAVGIKRNPQNLVKKTVLMSNSKTKKVRTVHYRCNFCTSKFLRREHVGQHIAYFHSSKAFSFRNNFGFLVEYRSCPICGRVWKKDELTSHILSNHQD